MSWTFGRKVGCGFGLSLLMLLFVGVLGYRGIESLMRNNIRATHSHQVLEKIAIVLSTMKDLETGQRGYLITGELSFLEPYQSAVKELDSEIAALRSLTADNPRQQAMVDELSKIAHAKLEELTERSIKKSATGSGVGRLKSRRRRRRRRSGWASARRWHLCSWRWRRSLSRARSAHS